MTTEQLLKASNFLENHKDMKEEYNTIKDLAKRNQLMASRITQLEARETKLHFMLHQACNEMESAFDDHGELDSVDIAVEYTVWAKFLKDNYGREDYGRVGRIQEWIDRV